MSKRINFQKEQVRQNKLTEMDTRVDLPAFGSLAPGATSGEPHALRRRFPLWVRSLAAVASVVVLVGCMVIVLARPRANTPHANVVSPPSVCQPFAWQVSNTSTTGELNGIAASSPIDAWAVGQTMNQSPLIEHWDGTRWNVMSSPQLQGKGGSLQVIAIVTPNDIWAAGEQLERAVTGPVAPIVGNTTLIEHWDGRNWAIVPSPLDRQGAPSATVLNSMTVVSAQDIWIVGARIYPHGTTQTSLVEHWDGRKWTLVLDQSRVLENGTQARASVLSTTTNADGQVLAGGAQVGSDKLYHAYLERWNGEQWQQVDMRSLGQKTTSVLALSAVSTNDVWAVVQHISGLQVPFNTIARWDGKTWKQVSAPGWLFGENMNPGRLLAVSSKNVWVMNSSPLVLAHWDGTSWSQIRLPANTVNLDTYANNFTVSVGATWVVGRRGNYGDGSTIRPLLEQQITCP